MSQAVLEIDRLTEELRSALDRDPSLVPDFNRRLDISWIYHDHALEGVVLSYHELNSSIDDAIISDVTLIPQYDDVRNHKAAVEYIRSISSKKKSPLGLEFLKKLHHLLSYESMPRSSKAPPKPPPGQYRKDNPMHRQYFHEIAPPEKISYQMRKFVQWLASAEAKRMHVLQRSSEAHHRLMAVFPWPRFSGRIARLLMNAMLLREGYFPVVIHAVDRQRYYESLRQPSSALTELVIESSMRMLDAAARFMDEGKSIPVA